MGLQIMNHRADMIGASFSMRRLAEGGTSVTCTLRERL
jgi:nitrate/nitrite-specific signal transduction histidine kinase